MPAAGDRDVKCPAIVYRIPAAVPQIAMGVAESG